MEYLSKSENSNINKIQNNKENIEHLLKLVQAMAPNPSDWEYTGEMTDSGGKDANCVCGHAIRYIFWIQNKKDARRLPIGSSCIVNSIPYLIESGAEDLAQRLTEAHSEFQKQINEAICLAAKRKREQTNNERIKILTKDMENLIEFLANTRMEISVKNSNGKDSWIPYPLYRNFRIPAPASKPGFTARRYVKAYIEYTRFYNRSKVQDNLPDLPEPMSEELKKV